jgi:hypothetical protein
MASVCFLALWLYRGLSMRWMVVGDELVVRCLWHSYRVLVSDVRSVDTTFTWVPTSSQCVAIATSEGRVLRIPSTVRLSDRKLELERRRLKKAIGVSEVDLVLTRDRPRKAR